MFDVSQPRAAVYARSSIGRRKSITQQDQACSEDAETLGWQVIEHYRDNVSASRFGRRSARPGWSALVRTMRQGAIDVVVVWEASRGDRRLTTWSEFLDLARECGVLVRVTDLGRTFDLRSNPDDWETLARSGVDSVAESERLSRRTRRGQLDQAQDGRPHGRVRWGYKRVHDPDTGDVSWVTDPDLAPLVQEIMERIANREPRGAIADDLNRRGVSRPNDAAWNRTRVREMVHPTYIGKRTYKGQEYPAQWPALVPEPLYRRAEAVLRDSIRTPNRDGRLGFLLSGVATCSVCGTVVQGRATRPDSKWKTDRYQCGKGCVSLPSEPVDEIVVSRLADHILDPNVQHELKELESGDDSEHETALAEVERLTGELDRFVSEAAEVGLSAARLAQVEKDYERKIAEASARAERTKVPRVLRIIFPVEFDEGRTVNMDLTDSITFWLGWDALTIPAQRSIIREMMTVTIYPGRGRGVRVPVEERVRVKRLVRYLRVS